MTRFNIAFAFCVLMVFDAAIASEPTEKIIESIRSWRKSFATIDITYTSQCRPALEERFPQLKDVEDLTGWGLRTHWRWADFGATLNEYCSLESGNKASREYRGATANLVFVARSGNGIDGAKNWNTIEYHVPMGKATGWAVVTAPLYPIWVNSRGAWLDEFLVADPAQNLSGKVEWLALVTHNENECPRFVLTWPKEDGQPPREIWLDPEHGFLPVKVFCPTGEPAFDYEVTEFKEIETGWWFPTKGFFGQRSRLDCWDAWIVEDVKRNQPFTTADFAPPAPDVGTALFRPGQEVITFGVPKPSAPTTSLRSKQSEKLQSESNVIAAPERSRWGLMLICASVVLVGIGVFYRWKTTS